MRDIKLRTAWEPEVTRCTDGNVGHDFRAHQYQQYGRPHTSWVCVWRHGIACGSYYESDPCWEIYHHRGDHRSRQHVTWPLGGNRPDQERYHLLCRAYEDGSALG